MKNKIGLISGFIFGLLAVFLATLVSLTAEFLSPLLFPIAFLIKLTGIYFPGILIISALLNGALFAFVGYMVQSYFGKKNSKIPIFVFTGVVVLFIILILIEYLVKGLYP